MTTQLKNIETLPATEASCQRVRDAHDKTQAEIGKVIVGQKLAISDAIMAIFSGTHFYYESAPGLGKTLLIRTIPHVISGYNAGMVQCTVDMLPSDVNGFMRFDEAKREYVEQRGKLTVEHCLFLVDEDNRAPGKVQAGFLQIMAEHELAIGEHVHRLNDLFILAGTRNPVENRMGTGTAKTIEALADRYSFRSTMMYGTREDDRELSRRTAKGLYAGHEPWVDAGCQEVISADEIRAFRKFIKTCVDVPEPVYNFVSEIVRATRPRSRVNPSDELKQHMPAQYQNAVIYGCSARAIQSLITLGKTSVPFYVQGNVAFTPLAWYATMFSMSWTS